MSNVKTVTLKELQEIYPSKHEWQGLTDSEKGKMAFIAGSDKYWLMRLVEDKLREKNQ